MFEITIYFYSIKKIDERLRKKEKHCRVLLWPAERLRKNVNGFESVLLLIERIARHTIMMIHPVTCTLKRKPDHC